MTCGSLGYDLSQKLNCLPAPVLPVPGLWGWGCPSFGYLYARNSFRLDGGETLAYNYVNRD